ncbi:MAG: A/G-specific adenine glycosylase [Verrucomicrobia bacterium]|nr:A/G-specific adenine glycosylase [Verrucomicrobiota bacterium]
MAKELIAQRTQFQRALLAWYRAHARVLPWREAPSLYKTVVSEFMLQQTQVKTVLPYLARWLDELPDFAALAAAPESRVLKLWEGLGYYSRARNLHALAKVVAAWPEMRRTPEAWRELPGVGPYTSAAITSISFDAPAACVDGNVVRILARLTADPTEFRDSATASKAFTPLAESLLPAATPGDHNQAMMELGATVCFRHNPLCLTCPVREFCSAARQGEPEAFPRLAAKQMEQRTVTRVWCERDGELLLHRSAAGARRFANIHELPTAEQAGLVEAKVARGNLLAKKRRGITRFQITEFIYAATMPREKLPAELVWVPRSELAELTLSGPHRRWVAEILAAQKE